MARPWVVLGSVIGWFGSTGCLVNIDFSGAEFRCEDGVCPSGLECNPARVCVAPGLDAGTDATLPSSAFRTVMTVGPLADRLERFPLRVRLDATRIEFGETAPGGADIFFTDAGGNVLAHEIETWLAAEAEVWVLAPALETGTTITMHFGGGAANVSSAVWSDYRSVFHLGDEIDSSATYAEVTDVGSTDAAGVIGRARGFTAGYFDLGTDIDFLAAGTEVTISAWVKRNAGVCTEPCTVFGASIGAGNSKLSRATLDVGPDGTAAFGVRDDDARVTSIQARAVDPLPADAWVWVAGTADLAADRVILYLDGTAATTLAGGGLVGAFDPGPSLQIAVGVDEDLVSGFFFGDVDEVRVRLEAMPGEWIAAQYRSLTDSLVSFGPIEVE